MRRAYLRPDSQDGVRPTHEERELRFRRRRVRAVGAWRDDVGIRPGEGRTETAESIREAQCRSLAYFAPRKRDEAIRLAGCLAHNPRDSIAARRSHAANDG